MSDIPVVHNSEITNMNPTADQICILIYLHNVMHVIVRDVRGHARYFDRLINCTVHAIDATRNIVF